MQQIRIGCASLNQTPLDWSGNYNNIKNAIQKAKENEIDILCLPELCVSGYNCEDMFLADWVIEKSIQSLIDISSLCNDITIIVGHPFKLEDKLYNCASVISHGKIRGITPKQFLANQEIYYEPRWFTAWSESIQAVKIANHNIPFGKLVYTFNEFNFGIEICEDAWNSKRPANDFLAQDVNAIFNLSASHFTFGKIKKRIELADEILNKNNEVTYAYANLLGNEAGRAIYDGSSYIKSKENLILSKRFSFNSFEIICADISYKAKNIRTNPSYKNVIFKSPTKELNISKVKIEKVQTRFFEKDEDNLKFHEFTYAVSLGIYDYLRKSGAQRIAISLSGGADSSACAILSNLGYKLALEEKGISSVANDLRIPSKNLANWDFLYCLYQKTENNSLETEAVAKEIAHNLGAFFQSIDINNNVEDYKFKIEEILNTKLTWENHNIPLQNIQARTRGPLIWFLANIKNALLISTSNRSEAAVGYTTMDGDTCGGLSPIGGIDKCFILQWLKWLETQNIEYYGNFSFLKKLNSLQPTAELKPKSDSQTDESDLMPYVILDKFEKLFIHRKRSPDEILSEVTSKFPNYSSKEIKLWLDKFLSLWRSNQWKRERYAPSFHLDDESLDPKTWCRYPILSGRLTP